ncbi:MAG: YodL domain-containing protein, partial [Lachnospiraceae bacterium]|nr:YodL domain-containing protein [Lachnospiraceae bacterium]
MADAKTEKQKVQEITEKLEQGIKELFESEKYKTYLNTMSKFHNYSFNNTMLIAMQKPDATLVAGFKAWQKNFDRHVKKGEKGIRILAPAPYKIKEEQEKLDPVTGEIMLDKNGMPITEEVEIKIPAFRVVPVFDVSQTDGKEMPDIGVNELSGSVEDYEDFMQALTEVSPVPITYEDIDGDAKGYFHTTDHRIAIQEGMSQSQTVKTAIHEVAHAKLHDRERNQDIDKVLDKDRNTKEVEAESVAYTVCQHFGIDTSDYSFGYIAGWSSDRDMKELKSSLDTIRKTASELITGIEDRLAELQKDRAVEQEQKQELEESPANREAQLLFGSEDRFGIYQLKDTEGARDIHFMGMDYLESKGIAVTKENYDLLYTAPLEEGTSLEDIYTRFNIDRPADFRGHSLSVSDVVVLHQNGEITSHYVDSFGYREVPEFTKELMAEHTKEQATVIDETTEILSEIAQEHANDEPDRENEVFLVNYNEWREVSTLDLEQNYFAIDDPYADGDFRLLHLQNQIKDITPAGVHYDTYEEAAAALYEAEREMANMPFNKENNIGSYMVNGRAQLERIMEARQLQKHMDIENDKVSYYVIADLSTWAENSPERSKLERFDSISEAMEAFQAYRGKDVQYSDDKARTTFGVSVHGIEFDVIHVRNNENVLSLDFTHSSEAKESKHFMDDLQTLSDSIGIDKVRVHRDMSPEEVKDFVKQRFEHQLKQGGLDDISLYMSRFDTLYEQGKMEKLMPTANQKHIEENVPITEWDNPYFEVKEPEQMAFSIKDKFVSIQTCTEGYDYSVFDEDYKLIDGGVYDNPDISIHAALMDVLEDFGLSEQDKRIPVDYEELMEKTEAVEREQLSKRIRAEVPEADSVVADFKAKTEELFNAINGQTQDDIEQTVWAYLQSKIDEYEIDVELVDVVVSGSRCRGLEKVGSDLDVVVEYKGREHEDDLFNAFNEDGLMIGGVKVDINPITEGKTGTLATYLPGVESYLAEKQAMQKAPAVEVIPEKTVTLTVAECGEFHSLGEFHENIASVEEAITVWKSIPPERMNGIPSIGINIHTEGTERYEDVEMDILSGKVIDLEVLDYVPDITDDPKAIEVIAELIDKLPDIEVRGSLEKWQAAILASQIDQLSYDYDTYQYQDTVEDREAQVANITEDIRNGNTGYLNDFLNAVISEGVREGITDIFGEGVEIDDSEAVQTARRAKELLDKLAEYKPLAKVEELTEQNYNMIDNVLNNGAEKKEQEQTKGRISIKEKLAEKRAV